MSRRNQKLGCAAFALSAFVCVAVFVAWPMLRFVASSTRHMTNREAVRFSIPGTNFSLTHSRIGNNPIVAEYNRDITYIAAGTIGKTTPLSIDTCGGYPINCYLTKADGRAFLRLDDAVSEHLLDLDAQTTYVVTHHGNDSYVGELVDDSTSSGWSMMNDDPSTLRVTVGGKEAIPMSDLTNGAAEVYVGCLTGGLDHLRFVPASESPEQSIRHLFER